MTNEHDEVVCGHEVVEKRKGVGRRCAYRNVPQLPIPADLALPTCNACGAWLLTRESAAALDAAMEPVYGAELGRRAREALATLGQEGLRQKDLEPILGLSVGYLSKLKNSKADPSAPLVSVLLLLARDVQRVDELAALWSGNCESPTASGPSSKLVKSPEGLAQRTYSPSWRSCSPVGRPRSR